MEKMDSFLSNKGKYRVKLLSVISSTNIYDSQLLRRPDNPATDTVERGASTSQYSRARAMRHAPNQSAQTCKR